MSPSGASPPPLRGGRGGGVGLDRGLAPPGYPPASLAGLEWLSHRFSATTSETCRMALSLNRDGGYIEPGFFMQIVSWFASYFRP
jgi:hypothetical protein